MTLGASNIVQSNSGNNSPTSTPTLTVSVSSPTAGHAVLVGISCGQVVTAPPAGFTQDAVTSAVGGPDTHVVYRKQLSTGETSWAFGLTSSAAAAWWVLEVSGLDPAPLVTGVSNGGQAGTSISTGTTSSVSQTDILVLASFNGLKATTANTWSGYTNSLVEVKDQGTTDSGSNQWSIAVADRFPGAGGTFTSTATASASVNASGLILVYKAAPPPAVSIDNVAIGGQFVALATVTLRDGAGTHLDLRTDETTTVQGSIVISGALAVTGTMNYALSQIPAETSQVTFAVGALVQSNLTGECMVVRDSWIDAGGAEWSNTTNRATQYSTAGWTVIGSALLN